MRVDMIDRSSTDGEFYEDNLNKLMQNILIFYENDSVFHPNEHS